MLFISPWFIYKYLNCLYKVPHWISRQFRIKVPMMIKFEGSVYTSPRSSRRTIKLKGGATKKVMADLQACIG
jgi:hypothetical protein